MSICGSVQAILIWERSLDEIFKLLTGWQSMTKVNPWSTMDVVVEPEARVMDEESR